MGTPNSYKAIRDLNLTDYMPYHCDMASQTLLLAPFSAKDIKREIFVLPPNKSPGPDGFTGEFFREAWGIVGQDVVSAIREFFESGQ